MHVLIIGSTQRCYFYALIQGFSGASCELDLKVSDTTALLSLCIDLHWWIGGTYSGKAL